MKIATIVTGPRRVRRMAHIARKGAARGLGFLLSRLELQRHVPWVPLPSLVSEARAEELAARLAAVLEELGPTFVKFGQMLATRPDILPEEYITELQRICHHVAPFSGEVSRAIIAQELGQPAGKVFLEFNEVPRASGSIAQVHEAVLRDGTPVVVKVRRPRIARIIEDDVAILTFLAAQADKVEDFQFLRLPMLVDEFARGIHREMDFITEASYTHKFRQKLKDDDRIQIPEVFWDYTTGCVLTMQRIEGTHLTESFRGAGPPIDRKAVARTVMDAYLRQFFSLGIFHADPHPGNILTTPDGRVALLDFGLVGRLSPRLRRDLSVCLVALGNGQVELIAEVLSEMGQVPEDVAVEDLKEELVSQLDTYASVPVEKINFQRSFQDMMGVIRKYRMDVPRDFVLFGRALVEITGVVIQLDPQLDVTSLAIPYRSRFLREKLSPANVERAATATGYHLGTLLTEGPRDVRRIIRKLERGLFEFTIRHEGFEKGLKELDQTGNRLCLSIILAAIIMASSTLLANRVGAIRLLGAQVSILGLLGLMFGLALGVWLILGILRSRRL